MGTRVILTAVVAGLVSAPAIDAQAPAKAAGPWARVPALLNDPQKAQQYMEQTLQRGQQAQVEVPEQLEKEQQFEAEAQTIGKQYETALAKARAPGEMGVPDWAWKEWDAILREWERAYAANGPAWFGTAGPIHAYIKRYRDFLVQERIPCERQQDEPLPEQYRMLEIPMDGRRSTAEYQAVHGMPPLGIVSLNGASEPPFVRPDPLPQSVTHWRNESCTKQTHTESIGMWQLSWLRQSWRSAD